jgi:hypothetical protein
MPAKPAARARQAISVTPLLAAQRRIGGEELEGARLQPVSDEDRRRLVEGDVQRRLTAAHGVIVHGREVVVNQRIGVDELYRLGTRLSPGGIHGRVTGMRCGHKEPGAQAFARRRWPGAPAPSSRIMPGQPR